MMYELYATIMVIAVFVVVLVLKSLLKKDICVLCASVSVVWVVLLAGLTAGLWQDRVSVAVLMGASLTGGYYYLESKLKKEWMIFRFPVFVTGLSLVFTVIDGRVNVYLWIITGILWLAVYTLYAFRNKSGFRRIVKNIIECCRRW